MAADTPDAPPPADPSPPRERDRDAYLAEQMERQKRGEPIDVEWVRAELERVRVEAGRRHARTQRQLALVTALSAAALLFLWIRGGGLGRPGGVMFLGLILVGLLAAWGLSRRRR